MQLYVFYELEFCIFARFFSIFALTYIKKNVSEGS